MWSPFVKRNLSSVPEFDNPHLNGLLVLIDGVAMGHTPRELSHTFLQEIQHDDGGMQGELQDDC